MRSAAACGLETSEPFLPALLRNCARGGVGIVSVL
jgi:hypothetical protein